MHRMLWFPLYIDDFMASKKVLRMTIGEQGAYLRLMMFAWSDPDCSLPKKESELQEMALWTEKTDGLWGKVRACFISHPEKKTRLYNPRLYGEWVKVEDLKAQRKEAANRRWNKPLMQPNNSNPMMISKDRSSKGLTPVSQEIQAIADKHFPPV